MFWEQQMLRAWFALMDPIDINRFVELVAGHSQKTPSLESLIELSVSFLRILRRSEISKDSELVFRKFIESLHSSIRISA